ncbi:MAG: glutamine-hydrolyzing carbamoyl-phosphate synthase small subunit [Planctomycetota bacterium]|nr:glutamine-hydrolyzing carbamoyl-phosphate synthase small subunit [Planctomycetota bacterium]
MTANEPTDPPPPGRLALEDGTVLHGKSFGASGTTTGELVFNTAMTGYQEILTDPSYRGQVVLLTYPHVGNYGVCPEDDESPRPWVEGLVVREASRLASNFRAGRELAPWLRDQGVVAIQDVDTRLLTRRIRTAGEMRVLLTTETEDSDAELVARVKASPGLEGRDLIAEVTRETATDWKPGFDSTFSPSNLLPRREGEPIRIVAIDCGIKKNILRSLTEAGFSVHVVPARTTADEIMTQQPEALFLSNGPGDPSAASYLVDAVRRVALDHAVPTFGICMGHQILSQVLGGRTYKMQFGHHGANHPVKELATGKIAITSQNHSFAVDADSLPDDVEVTHLNLNDGTVEGLRHKSLPMWSVQFHPEAAPGPHDALGLFIRFRDGFDR